MQSTQWLRAVVLAVFDSVEQENVAAERTEFAEIFEGFLKMLCDLCG